MAAKRKVEEPKLSAAAARIAKRELDYDLEDRFLPIDVVIQIAGLGKTMIYRKVRDGSFPPPYKPGGSATRWSEAEIRNWKRQVMEQQRAA
jgi:prophage regulatory protein